MLDKQSKIHSLGPRKMSSTGKTFYNTQTQNGFFNKPILPVTTVPQPQIRYLLVQHPQFDSLVKQLSSLRAKYDQLLLKFQQKPNQQTLRQNIKEVMQSTHDIETRMSRIVQDANRVSQDSQDKQNNPMYKSKKMSKQQHEKQCLQIIQTVNRATQKIEELEQRNKKLNHQIQNQKQWKQKLDAQNKRLRLMLQNMENQKQQEIQKLKKELKQLSQKQNRQFQHLQINIHQKSQNLKQTTPVSMIKSKKIRNDEYLQESRNTFVGQQVSGFSRLTLNGQGSRVSKIYQ